MTTQEASSLKFSNRLIVTKTHNGIKSGKIIVFGSWYKKYNILYDVTAAYYNVDINYLEIYKSSNSLLMMVDNLIGRFQNKPCYI